MKILFNTHPWAFQQPGGGEVIMEKLRAYLTKRGHIVEYFSFAESKLEQFDIIHHFSTLDRSMWHSYSKVEAPVVLTPTLWPRDSKLYQLKYNVKYHLKSLLGIHKNDLKFQLNYIDLLLPTTELEKVRIEQFLSPTCPQQVLTNGVDIVDPLKSNNLFVEQHNIADYLLFVGNVSPVKNLKQLILAANKLDQKLVVIGGYAQENREYYEQCRAVAQDGVHFIGPLPRDSQMLSDAYYGAKAVVVPSEFETCSLVALEAGVRGVPVLLTQGGGTKEIFQDYVWYLDPTDLNSICNTITRCDREQFDVLRLQKFIQQNYSWDVIAEQLERIYRQLGK